MKLIVGLGNPGKEYIGTRHNAGFYFLDKMIRREELAPADLPLTFQLNKKFDSETIELLREGEKIVFVKPQTFMNLSGKAVHKIMDYYELEPKDLIVIADDKDLPVSTVRIRQEGSSAGQKGLQSVIEHLGTDNFLRIRIGVNATDSNATQTENLEGDYDTADFVLSKFSKREAAILDETIDEAIGYILPFLGSKFDLISHTINIKE